MSGPKINIKEIRGIIHGTHKEFLKKIGASSEMVSFQKKVAIETVLARIELINWCFLKEEIIKLVDEFTDSQEPFGHTLSAPVHRTDIGRESDGPSVSIYTDGSKIVLETKVANSAGGVYSQQFMNVLDDNFDWKKFSIALLDFVHVSLYYYKEAAEEKVNSVFTR